MGASATRSKSSRVVDKYPSTPFLQHGLAISDEVHHYLPPNLPIFPVINPSYVDDCLSSWRDICKGNTKKMDEYSDRSGIELFQDEFFHRLFQRETSMEAVFGSSDRRNEVLLMAMTFMLKGDKPNETMNRCRHLGHRHRSIRLIRPHHFAVYVSTCIEVIMYWLGKQGSPTIAEAWSNVMGFHLKYILQAYLFRNVDHSESAQNTVAAGATPALQRPG